MKCPFFDPQIFSRISVTKYLVRKRYRSRPYPLQAQRMLSRRLREGLEWYGAGSTLDCNLVGRWVQVNSTRSLDVRHLADESAEGSQCFRVWEGGRGKWNGLCARKAWAKMGGRLRGKLGWGESSCLGWGRCKQVHCLRKRKRSKDSWWVEKGHLQHRLRISP